MAHHPRGSHSPLWGNYTSWADCVDWVQSSWDFRPDLPVPLEAAAGLSASSHCPSTKLSSTEVFQTEPWAPEPGPQGNRPWAKQPGPPGPSYHPMAQQRGTRAELEVCMCGGGRLESIPTGLPTCAPDGTCFHPQAPRLAETLANT